MESTSISLCYICSDKRRSAETDAAQTRVNSKPYEDTFKETLLKAIASGIRDEDIGENGESETEMQPSTSGSPSFSSQREFTTEYLYKKVESSCTIFICRRCEGLLRDFDYHERQVFLIGETIKMFLTKQDNPKTNDNDSSCDGSSSIVTVCKEKKRLSEKQGILAAFRAMRKSNPIVRSRGRKRKEMKISEENSETSESEHTKDTDIGIDISDLDADNSLGVRTSKRIQRRREEGLVIRWGDVHGETNALEAETESQGSIDKSFHPGDMKPRRRGRKPNSGKLMKGSGEVDKIPGLQSETSLKYECPFCYRCYIPSLSRIHGCISYKNQLRCMVCNIFFTSYIRLEKHLEVIHLKQKDLKCSEPGCNFTCISQPALTLHEHFHRVNDAAGSNVESSVCSVTSGPNHVVVTADLNAERDGVTIVKDDHGSVCSPDTVDEVSFQFDEKTLVSVDATVNSVKIKSAMREPLLPGVETCKVVLKCDGCNLEFRSKKLHDDHLKEDYCALQKDGSEMTAEKNVNYAFLDIGSRSVPEIFVKQGLKETLTSGPLKDNNELNPTKCKFHCPSCSKPFTLLKSLDEHVRNCHTNSSKIINTSEANINYSESNSEGQGELPMKCSFLSMNSKEAPEVGVKKNFSISQTPVWMVGKTKDPNR